MMTIDLPNLTIVDVAGAFGLSYMISLTPLFTQLMHIVLVTIRLKIQPVRVNCYVLCHPKPYSTLDMPCSSSTLE